MTIEDLPTVVETKMDEYKKEEVDDGDDESKWPEYELTHE